jgi:nucleolar protein 15
MKGFFSQFGDVKNVRMSRSKKTAQSKGYAFLEFKHPEVAPIAAQAMDGYMMFAQKLKVHVVKRRDVHPELMKGANQVFKQKPWRSMAAAKHNKDRSGSESDARVARALKRDKVRQKAIAAAGIQYSYDSLADALPKKAKRTVFAET